MVSEGNVEGVGYSHGVTTRHNDVHPSNGEDTAFISRDGRIVIAVETPNFIVSLVEASVLEDLMAISNADSVSDIEHLHGRLWICAVSDGVRQVPVF